MGLDYDPDKIVANRPRLFLEMENASFTSILLTWNYIYLYITYTARVCRLVRILMI